MKKVISMVLLLAVLFTAMGSATVSAESRALVIDESYFNIVVEENGEQKDLNELFKKAKQETEASKNIHHDKNDNIIYEVRQNIAKYKNNEGDTLQKVAITRSYKVEDKKVTADLAPSSLALVNYMLSPKYLAKSKGDGKWDSSFGAFLSLTIYWTEYETNGRKYAKLNSASGEVGNFNSRVKVWNIKTLMGQSGVTENHGYQEQTDEKTMGKLTLLL